MQSLLNVCPADKMCINHCNTPNHSPKTFLSIHTIHLLVHVHVVCLNAYTSSNNIPK